MKTTESRTIELYDVRQARALAAERMEDEATGKHTKHEGLRTTQLNAASEPRFAQITWAVRYSHGQKVKPTVEIERHMIRCAADVTGEADADSGVDWTEFLTTIDELPSGRYRIVAPLKEVTLDVP